MMQDITELRQAEHELRASEARFRTFVDHATDAFSCRTTRQRHRRQPAGLREPGLQPRGADKSDPRDIDAALDEAPSTRLGQRAAAKPSRSIPAPAQGRYACFRSRSARISSGKESRGSTCRWPAISATQARRGRAPGARMVPGVHRPHQPGMQGPDLERMMCDVLDVSRRLRRDRAWLITHATRTLRPAAGHRARGRSSLARRSQRRCADRWRQGRRLRVRAGIQQPGASGARRSCAALRGPSQIAMAVRPKVDQPYLFGLHQCSYERVWTEPEKRLFEEVGPRWPTRSPVC